MATKEIPKAENVWEDIFAHMQKADKLFQGKKKRYQMIDFILKVCLSTAAISLSIFLITLIRAYWVCGF